MRQVSQDAANAFHSNTPGAGGNTTVTTSGKSTLLILHGHTIAKKSPRGTFFSLCGYPTVTTRERLNAVGINVYQKDHEQYYGEVKINPNRRYKA